MGNILGGGGGGGGGGGFLGNLLGGLPDPLGVGKMLGITKDEPSQMPMPQQQQQQLPPGMQFMQPPGQQSGVSGVPGAFSQSPMSKTGFGIGGGGR